MTYYHYTSLNHLRNILKDGLIKTTYSNLKRPINLRIEKGNLVSDTDNYKPVVWLTDTLDFDNAKDNGLYGGTVDKTECAIAVEARSYHNILKWENWVMRNMADWEWTKALIDTAPNYKSWYISEKPIAIDDSVKIIFRPDIANQLSQKAHLVSSIARGNCNG